jgi:hypothetical protein
VAKIGSIFRAHFAVVAKGLNPSWRDAFRYFSATDSAPMPYAESTRDRDYARDRAIPDGLRLVA